MIATREAGFAKILAQDAVLGKGNSTIRDRDDRSSGSGGIVVEKTREYEIMTPIPDPAILIVCDTSFFFLVADLNKPCPNDLSP